ncbi:Mur ligase family protein [Chlamydiia bacterium]|nr:Mur ligase family protein [Chlamydiia bacterium]
MDILSHICLIILGFGKTGKSIHAYLKYHNIDHNILPSTLPTIEDRYILKTYKHGHVFENQLSKAELINLIKTQKKVYISPGIKPTDDIIKVINQNKITCYTDIDLCMNTFKGKSIAVTGTFGKSSLCKWIETITSACPTVYSAVGNIGNSPLYSMFKGIMKTLNYAVELSSYQLYYMSNFQPYFDAVVILNCHEKHIDWHGTFKDYRDAKLKLLNCMKSDGIAYVHDSIKPYINHKYIKYEPMYFGLSEMADLRFVGNVVYLKQRKIFSDRKGLFKTNLQKEICLQRIASLMILDVEVTESMLLKEALMDYRLQVIKGVECSPYTFINDSKSTHPLATMFAMKSNQSSYVLITYASTICHELLFPYVLTNPLHLKHICVIVDLDDISMEYENMSFHDNIEKALQHLKDSNHQNTDVIFSPGKVSYGEFSDFEQRGRYFMDKIIEFFT